MAKHKLKAKAGKQAKMKETTESKSGTKPTHPSKAEFAKREKRLEGKPM